LPVHIELEVVGAPIGVIGEGQVASYIIRYRGAGIQPTIPVGGVDLYRRPTLAAVISTPGLQSVGELVSGLQLIEDGLYPRGGDK
jgi:hypothetical protein